MVTEKNRKKSSARKGRSGHQFIVDANGKPTAVILPIDDYEDLCDIAAVEAAKGEPSIPWDEVKQRLKADGLLPD